MLIFSAWLVKRLTLKLLKNVDENSHMRVKI